MAIFSLSWTPAGGLNSTGQQVQYKLPASSTWTTATTLSASADDYLLEGLDDNVIYDIRIVSVCAYGGPAPGTLAKVINITCPDLTITPTHNSVAFTFTDLGGDIEQYLVQLLNAAGSSVLAFKVVTASGGVVSDSFTGLSAITNYQLRVTPQVDSFSKQCTGEVFSTTSTPTCNTPSGLTVEIEEESASS